MTENKIELEVSDWVTFLSNEKFGFNNTLLSLASFFVAAFSIIIIYLAHSWYKTFGIGFFMGSAIGWYTGTGRALYARGKLAGTILDKMAEGKIIDKEDIQKEWIDGVTKIRGKSSSKIENGYSSVTNPLPSIKNGK